MQEYCYHCMRKIRGNEDKCLFCGESLSVEVAPHYLLPGTILNNRYIVGLPIGEGGFGITYIGYDPRLDIKIAVKEYFPKGLASRNHIAESAVDVNKSEQSQTEYFNGKNGFLNEARIIAKFSGDNGIVDVRDYFEQNGTAYIVMEYIDGASLHKCLEDKKYLSEEETLKLFAPIMKSLKNVHNEGLIHRDISPENIMLTGNKIKLIDFGASRLSSILANKELSVYYKSGYAPAEQYSSSSKQGPWTDVYSVAATMYKCVTGVIPPDPFSRIDGDKLKKLSAINKNNPVSEQFEKAIFKGLSINSSNRYKSIAEFEKALPSVEDYKKTVKDNSDVINSGEKPRAKSKTKIAIAIVLVAALIISALAFTFRHTLFSGASSDINILSVSLLNKNDPEWATVASGDILDIDGVYYYDYRNLDKIWTDKENKICQYKNEKCNDLIKEEDGEGFFNNINYLNDCLYYCTDKSVWKYDMMEGTKEILFTSNEYLQFLWTNTDYYILADSRYIYKNYFNGEINTVFDVYDFGYGASMFVESYDENGIDISLTNNTETDFIQRDIRYDFKSNSVSSRVRLSKSGEKLKWYTNTQLNDDRKFLDKYMIQQKFSSDEVNFYYDEEMIYSYALGGLDKELCYPLGVYKNHLIFYVMNVNHGLYAIYVLDSKGNVVEKKSEETSLIIPDSLQNDGTLIYKSSSYYDGIKECPYESIDINGWIED